MNLDTFCNKFEDMTIKENKISSIIKEGRELLSELMTDTQWFREFLRKMIIDPSFRQQQKPSRWLNEYTLHRSMSGNFLMLAYIWEPHQIDVIHDHNSWGIIGTLTGEVSERKYRRIDDGKKDGYAELEETNHMLMDPGKTTSVMPMESGIHRMENMTENSVSINIYGKPVRKGYLHFYDYENRAVTRAYTYPLYRTALAVRTLGYMNGARILEEAMNLPVEDILRKEITSSLNRIDAASDK